MSSGRPELIQKIREEIRSKGPVTFARFMELALYDPDHGYYAAATPSRPRIGRDGDFCTSPEVHAAFARAVARQLVEMDSLLGHPDPFTFVEMGPGTGAFMRDLLSTLHTGHPSLAGRLETILIERNPAMKAAQAASLAALSDAPSPIRWDGSLDDLVSTSMTGAFFSNELIDAFPVHRVAVERGELREVYLVQEDEKLCERLGPLSTDRVAGYLTDIGVRLVEGQVVEVNLEAIRWMQDVARVLRRGFVLTVDYGHTARDLYDPARKKGTLMCYAGHRAGEEPYENIGLQDMTAHVDFTSLALAGERAGLEVAGFTNQLSFLTGLGIEDELHTLDPESPECRQMIALLHPFGMGRTFKVLIQHKGLGRPELAGLRHKAFFESALAGH